MRVIIGLKLVGLNCFILSKELFGPLEAATWKFLYFLFIWAKSRRVRISCLQRHNSLMPKQLCSFSSVTIYRSVSFPSLLIRASISAVRNMFACIYIYYPKKCEPITPSIDTTTFDCIGLADFWYSQAIWWGPRRYCAWNTMVCLCLVLVPSPPPGCGVHSQ